MIKQDEPVTLFYSYAHEDEMLRNELEKRLNQLRQQGIISEWHHRKIQLGEIRVHEIDAYLKRASVILVLVSPDFLSSDYCYNSEMQHALELHEHGDARVIPIILRPCEWQHSPLKDLPSLPHNGKPVTKWANQDEAFADIMAGIRRAIEDPSLSTTAPIMLAADRVLQRTLKGPKNSDYVRCTAWSPDGKQIASGSVDRTVRLWDATTGKLLHTLKKHEGPVSAVAWSPDGTQLASSSYDATVRLWDATTGKLLHTLKKHEGQVYSVAWSPDGTQRASSSYDKTVRLWDATTGELLRTLEGHTDSIRSVSWAPDNKQIASAANDKTVRLWDATTGELLRTLEGHTDYIRLVAWSPNGEQLASGSHDGTVKLWNPTNGTLLHSLSHKGQVCSVAWFRKGPLLASVSYSDSHSFIDAKVYIRHTGTWKSLAVITGLTGYTHSSWHPDSPLLATGGQQKGDIAILNLEELLTY